MRELSCHLHTHTHRHSAASSRTPCSWNVSGLVVLPCLNLFPHLHGSQPVFRLHCSQCGHAFSSKTNSLGLGRLSFSPDLDRLQHGVIVKWPHSFSLFLMRRWRRNENRPVEGAVREHVREREREMVGKWRSTDRDGATKEIDRQWEQSALSLLRGWRQKGEIRAKGTGEGGRGKKTKKNKASGKEQSD